MRDWMNLYVRCLPQPFYADHETVIFHADCRNVMPFLDPAKVSLLLSDPPYGINFKLSHTKQKRSRFEGVRIRGDDKPFDPSLLLLFPRLVLFGGNHYARRLPEGGKWLVWDKQFGSTIENDFASFELIWTNLKGGRIFRHLWCGYLKASERGIPRVHPTQKPVAIMRWLIERYSQPGDLVLDPFMGGGSTLVAAKETGRRAIGIEITRRYCEAAVQRLANLRRP